jgi:hypothetical protein
VFDLTAVFEGGGAEERRGVDLCRQQRIGFGDPDLPVREFALHNDGERTIQQFFARPAGNEAWGPDRLGASVLPAGERFVLRLRARGCALDLRAVYEGGDEEERAGADICVEAEQRFAGSAPPRPPAAPERSFTLVNRIGAPVQELYVSATEDDDWGPDRLGSAVLARDARREVTLRTACLVDLRIVFAGGGAEERREVDICRSDLVVLRPGWTWAERLDEGAGPVPADSPVRPGGVRFRNRAAVPVVELYADPPGATRGPDRLGATVLGAGEALDYVPADGACAAEVTAVFRDGRELRLPAGLCDGAEVVLQ